MKVGVLGGGQLAQMLALAGYPLGIKTVALESTASCPAGLVTDVVVGDYTDSEKLKQLADSVDVITYEFENVHVPSIETITTPEVYPAINALSIAQDRLAEKTFFDSVAVPTTQYFSVDTLEDLEIAIEQIGLPAVLKTRRLGYDGKGQFVIKNKEELQTAWKTLGQQNLIVENKINFDKEVSCLAVRGLSGEIAFYDLVENQHVGGILRQSKAILHEEKLTLLAQKYVEHMLKRLNYVGVLAVEFFVKDEMLIANEMAPRVHNSGHWTIEGAHTSQFENHLRAILGLPLGNTQTIGQPVMINVIGKLPVLSDILNIPYVHYHDYGKLEKPGRKLAHVTMTVDDHETYGRLLDLLPF